MNAGTQDRFQFWIIGRVYSRTIQAVIGVSGAAIGCAVLGIASTEVHGLEISVVSYIATGWASSLGALVIYVAIRLGQFARQIEKLSAGSMRMSRWYPASTPGVIALSQLYLRLLVTVVIFTAVAELVAVQVPDYKNAIAVHIFFLVAPVLGGLLGIGVGIFPQRILHRLILEAKLKSVSQVDKQIDRLPGSWSKAADAVHVLVQTRARVMDSPALPFGTAWLVPMSVGLLGPLLAFIIGVRRAH